jgi:hypothetical protein
MISLDFLYKSDNILILKNIHIYNVELHIKLKTISFHQYSTKLDFNCSLYNIKQVNPI